MSEQELAIPSNRIRFALEAMREFEARDGCEIDMSVWRDSSRGICYACCGGAALLKRNGLIPHPNQHEWMTIIISAPDSAFEISLNDARMGDVDDMFAEMDFEKSKGKPFNRLIADYDLNPTQFYTDMETLADDLQAAGY